jgi:hypothetical protein
MERRELGELRAQRTSWCPTAYRATMSKNREYVVLVLEGHVYSIKAEILMEILVGNRDSARLFKLMEP